MQTQNVKLGLSLPPNVAVQVLNLIQKEQKGAACGVEVEAAPATTTRRTRKPKATEETFELDGRNKNIDTDSGPSDGPFGDQSLDEMNDQEQTETEQEVTEQAEDEQPPLNLSDVQGACRDHAKKHGKAETMKILGELKITDLTKAKPEQYAAIVSALK